MFTEAVIIMIVVIFAGYAHPLWVLLFLGVYRLFQDYVLSPTWRVRASNCIP